MYKLVRYISDQDLQAGLRFAHTEAVKNLAEAPIKDVFTDPSYGKFERGKTLDNIAKDVKKVLEEEGDEESIKVLSKTIDTVRKKVVRNRIISEESRVDGRQLDEVRPLYCKAGYASKLHGSALFSRGETQVACIVTLGAPTDAQWLDSLVGPPLKRFMLHYSFSPFCIDEVGKRGGLNKREVGHGLGRPFGRHGHQDCWNSKWSYCQSVGYETSWNSTRYLM
ncbi:Polyribonucleotide nucleotidyltransferase 2, mitochondrial [Trifolium repens]|nr:Polyribonucleotide nucleotidyltransferase 2, mitochondrial [Trifolium repens]